MNLPDITRRGTFGFLHALFVPFRGSSPDGVPPSSEPVCSSLRALRACDIAHRSVLLVGIAGVADGRVTWVAGDHRATPARLIDQDIFASRAASLAAGAWVRQVTNGVSFLQAGAGAQPRSLEDKAREIVSVFDFGAKGDGVTDDTAAFNAAIATGRRVSVPYTTAGYAVADIRVVDNMQVVGEKAGMALAPTLIVNRSDAAAFRNHADISVFHCVFENLACRAAPGITGASFYAQATRTQYAGYFTFRNIETYLNLRVGYVGLFIFALWDRCRDGYLGNRSDNAHQAIVALAARYGQTNRQNINRIRDSMFFNAFGGDGAITGSYGTLWTIENSNFEALRTRAVAAYNVFQLRFSNCWFEAIDAPAVVHAGNFAGTHAASTVTFDHCTFALTGTAPRVVTVDTPGTVSLRDNMFSPIAPNARLCDTDTQIAVNEDNLVDGQAAADFLRGTYPDSGLGGRRRINGATDNRVTGMTLQNEGGLSATQGFLSRTDIQIASSFVTIATSQTGLGGTCVVSGYDPKGGAQVRLIKDWQGEKVRDVVTPLNATGKVLTFRVAGQDLQVKVDTGALVIFTTLLH